jgi:tRNA modification GTPase
MNAADTIAAPATPAGRGGIGIVRVSGPRAGAIAAALLGRVPAPRQATLSAFHDAAGEPIDAGIAIFFPGPASFTGEDVLELQGHGGPVVMDLLMARVLELGARPARPGEFTERAFFAGKVDLAQAEAVADLIEAGSAQAARAAMRSLQGEFSREVEALAAAVTELRVYVEAAIDFPDEDVEFLGSPEVAARLSDIDTRFARIAHVAGQGRLLRDGLHAVIAGKPNAGKSSLMNRLAGHEAAIVTDIPGTTRDLLRERIHVDGLPLHLVDTAGLREAGDVVEGEGVRRARAEIARADLVLYVVDSTAAPSPQALREELDALPAGVPVLVVWNKADLKWGQSPFSTDVEGADGERRATEMGTVPISAPAVVISATTGLGLDELRARLKERAGYEQGGAGTFSARARHVEALGRARGHFERAKELLAARSSFELVAEELRLGHDALGEITGAVSNDDLLGKIFGSFCIGK